MFIVLILLLMSFVVVFFFNTLSLPCPTIDEIRGRRCQCVAVDRPSGVAHAVMQAVVGEAGLTQSMRREGGGQIRRRGAEKVVVMVVVGEGALVYRARGVEHRVGRTDAASAQVMLPVPEERRR